MNLLALKPVGTTNRALRTTFMELSRKYVKISIVGFHAKLQILALANQIWITLPKRSFPATLVELLKSV